MRFDPSRTQKKDPASSPGLFFGVRAPRSGAGLAHCLTPAHMPILITKNTNSVSSGQILKGTYDDRSEP
jgi:hypothetical protein